MRADLPDDEEGEKPVRQVAEFEATVQRDQDGTWWFLSVPTEVRQAFKPFERRGHVRLLATVGSTSWHASLMPWKDGSGQVVVNRRVRDAEGIEAGATVRIRIQAPP